jgi:hypothetical protein
MLQSSNFGNQLYSAEILTGSSADIFRHRHHLTQITHSFEICADARVLCWSHHHCKTNHRLLSVFVFFLAAGHLQDSKGQYMRKMLAGVDQNQPHTNFVKADTFATGLIHSS